MALNFGRLRNKSIKVGGLSKESAHKAVNESLGHLGLSERVKHDIAHDLYHAGETITGDEMNDIINRIHGRGHLSAEKTEKVKDALELPDDMNAQWK